MGEDFGGNGYGSSPQMGGLEQLFSGLFSHDDRPYGKAGQTFEDYLRQAQGFQNPFYQAGTGAIPQFQEWLQGQKDPSEFINKLMGQYQQSPYAKYLQDQSMRTGINAASVGGIGNMGGAGVGSTPFLQQAQQNAQNISSQDMQNWLSRVLGINTQYGEGLNNMMGRGQNAANSLSDMTGRFGEDIAKMRFGEETERNNRSNDIWGGLFNIAKKGLFG